MSLPFFLDWPHLIFRDFLLTMCMNIILFIAKEIDTCAALHVPGKGFSLLLANLILLLWRMKSLVGGHSSWKLEEGWSCNGKLASERLQESQACPLCFLRGPEIPNTASRKTSPSLGKRVVLAFQDWQRGYGEFSWTITSPSALQQALDTHTYMQVRYKNVEYSVCIPICICTRPKGKKLLGLCNRQNFHSPKH